MNQALIEQFSPPTYEESLLLKGLPLQQEAYTDHQVFLVESQLFLQKNQSVGIRQHTRFVDFPTHWHDYVEMMVVLQGSVSHVMAGGEPICLQAGELLLINRHSSHHILACGEKDIAVNIIFKPSFLSFVAERLPEEHPLTLLLLDGLNSRQKGPAFLHFNLNTLTPVQKLLESIFYTLLPPYKEETSSTLYQLEMNLLFSHLCHHPLAMVCPSVPHQENPLVVLLLKEIKEQFSSFSLKDFAKTHQVSSAYVSRIVKEATGFTCTALLQQVRLQQAKILLLQTDLSIKQICMAVGYSNTSYFYRLFFDHTHTNPTLFRLAGKRKEPSFQHFPQTTAKRSFTV
ncbi:MAG: AraC family transcriptional regulator [Clostridiales bacterium]|nr:AraC family transcriptional regulator [Clostridiales bacterium]